MGRRKAGDALHNEVETAATAGWCAGVLAEIRHQ